jgi:hypothetical protein
MKLSFTLRNQRVTFRGRGSVNQKLTFVNKYFTLLSSELL